MITGKIPASRLSIKLMIAAMLLCLSILGCGRKEMPSAPRQVPPQPVTDLRVQLNGDQVELTWSFSKTLSGSEPIKGFGVFRASESVSESCSNCPFLFTRVADIPFLEGREGASVMTYRDTLEKGTRYRYKVICYSTTGLSSKDSNVVVAEME
ncbi:MAG: hypothetical protein Q7U40_00355 [Desulfatirhabdiaceae bacterium]|nr:hypothetical protein [Desulfatirhabdiaceae bacterium]